MSGVRQVRKSEAAMMLRIENLERAFAQMKTTLKWQTAIGIYLSSIITTLVIKIMFYGI